MIQVLFYDFIEDSLLRFAVLVARTDGKWVFCKHKERSTYEIPGGHRESCEPILETAKRELQEETGAVSFDIVPISVYSVREEKAETFGVLYYADIRTFGEIHSEMEGILITDQLVTEWTYPLIQPKLLEKVILELEL